jgi:hypothetical protein
MVEEKKGKNTLVTFVSTQQQIKLASKSLPASGKIRGGKISNTRYSVLISQKRMIFFVRLFLHKSYYLASQLQHLDLIFQRDSQSIKRREKKRDFLF